MKGAFGSTWVPRDEAEAMIEELEDSGVAMISVPLAAVRGALAGALAINGTLGQGLPPTYELWEPLLHDAYPPAPDEPVTALLDDAPYAGRSDLIAETAALFAHPFFQGWGFEPEATLAALATLTLPDEPEISEEELFRQIAALATPATCAQLRNRLRQPGCSITSTTRPRARPRVAAAAALTTTDQNTLVTIPFLRELTAASVEQARWPTACSCDATTGRRLLAALHHRSTPAARRPWDPDLDPLSQRLGEGCRPQAAG
ncbi:MAG: hypothetical protein U0841_26930 [Chloroflexia bacterium]